MGGGFVRNMNQNSARNMYQRVGTNCILAQWFLHSINSHLRFLQISIYLLQIMLIAWFILYKVNNVILLKHHNAVGDIATKYFLHLHLYIHKHAISLLADEYM